MGPVPRRFLAIVSAAALLAGCQAGRSEPRPVGGSSTPSGGPSPAAGSEIALAEAPEREPIVLNGDLVAVPTERLVPMWEEPGTSPRADFRLDALNPTGRLAPLLVERAVALDDEAWYEVLLPIRPNGSTAWVRAADVEVHRRTERIEVDLSRRLLWRYHEDRLVDRIRVGVGTPSTPTGVGRFYVWVKVRYANPGGPYGAAALGLSGFSPVLSEWPGEGRMAVHGTASATDRGSAVSHGCVRVYNPELMALLDVPLGTPVVIRA
jgi:hypothetical protein